MTHSCLDRELTRLSRGNIGLWAVNLNVWVWSSAFHDLEKRKKPKDCSFGFRSLDQLSGEIFHVVAKALIHHGLGYPERLRELIDDVMGGINFFDFFPKHFAGDQE